MIHTYHITGMTCNKCVAKVKSELLKLPGIISADIQLVDPQASIVMQKHISIDALQNAVSKAGKYIISGNTTISETTTEEKDSYYPIFVIFGYIAGITFLAQYTTAQFNLMLWMQYFMGGFFIVFSFFKLLNLKGFAESYSIYDIVAKKIKIYGVIYPFIELLLGIAFITGFNPVLTNAFTLIIMTISTVGVVQKLLKKEQFQCACLGTIIKLPLSKVTLFEDLLMIIMSGISLTVLL